MTPNLWARCAPISAWNTKWRREGERRSTFSRINHQCGEYLHPRDSVPSPSSSLATKTELSARPHVLEQAESFRRKRAEVDPKPSNERVAGILICVKGHEFFPRLYLARKQEYRTSFESLTAIFLFFLLLYLPRSSRNKLPSENFKVCGKKKNEEK